MSKEENKQVDIANTIIQQIKYADKWALGAYGAQNFTSLKECDVFQGGLKFQVNGYNHQGSVVIQLKWVDTYTISFIDVKGSIVKSAYGIYCDQLVEVLDYIEEK